MLLDSEYLSAFDDDELFAAVLGDDSQAFDNWNSSESENYSDFNEDEFEEWIEEIRNTQIL